MATYATGSAEFGNVYGTELSRRMDINSRFRSNALQTNRMGGNVRYRGSTSFQNNKYHSGSHLPYLRQDNFGSYPIYDSTLGGPCHYLPPTQSRNIPMGNYKDPISVQNFYNSHVPSTNRLSQHEKSSVYNNDSLYRGGMNTDRFNSDRIYGADMSYLMDSRRYAPSNFRIPPNPWNPLRDCLPTEYDKYHRSPKASLQYPALNNHSASDAANNSNYTSERSSYEPPQSPKRKSYFQSYMNGSCGTKQNQYSTRDRRNAHLTSYYPPHRSGLNGKEPIGYKRRLYSSVSMNNLHTINDGLFEKSFSCVRNEHTDIDGEEEFDDGKFPLGPATAKEKYGKYLTVFEKEEILRYPEIYFVGKHAKKRQPNKNLLISGSKEYNFQGVSAATWNGRDASGYDDSQSSYIVVVNDHIAYRYEVLKLLGKGSFGQVVQALDHKTGQNVALKIIRSEERFARQAKEEIRILQKLNEQDTENRHNIVRLLDNFKFRSHVCMVFELLGSNLYELLSLNEFRGLKQAEVCAITKGILECLELLFKNQIIHCDLKPENVLLQHPNRSAIKVIDFGSSCEVSKRVYTYIQSRFYRAPEIILGLSYGTEIDMWSLGCIVVEMITGAPLFPGEDARDQLACIMEMLGIPPARMITSSKEAYKYFMSDGEPRYLYEQEKERREEQKLGESTTNGYGESLGSRDGDRKGTEPSAHRVKPKNRSRSWRPRQEPGSLDLLTVLTTHKNSSVCAPGADKLDKRLSRSRAGIAEVIDPDMLDFINRCLIWWPEDRMSPSEALNHPWITKNKSVPSLNLGVRSIQMNGNGVKSPEEDRASNASDLFNGTREMSIPDDLLQQMKNVRLRSRKASVEEPSRRTRRNSQQELKTDRAETNAYRRYSTGHEYGRQLASLSNLPESYVDRRHSARGRRANGREEFRDFLNNDQESKDSEVNGSQRSSYDIKMMDMPQRHRPRRPSIHFRDGYAYNGLHVDDSRSRVSAIYDSTL